MFRLTYVFQDNTHIQYPDNESPTIKKRESRRLEIFGSFVVHAATNLTQHFMNRLTSKLLQYIL